MKRDPKPQVKKKSIRSNSQEPSHPQLVWDHAFLKRASTLNHRREQKLLEGAGIIQSKILKARRHPADFIELCFLSAKRETIKLEWFHREWLEFLLTERRIQITASKSHGKTTLLLGFALWSIGNNPNIRIKLLSSSDDKAKERLALIQSTIEHNPMYKLVFPHIRPRQGGPWHKTACMVERDITDKDPTVEVAGILGSIEGGRADKILLDDISDYRNSIAFPQLRETIKKKFWAEIVPMLESDGQVASIATPHSESDVVASIEKNREWKNVLYCVGDGVDRFLPLWEKRWPRDKLIQLFNEIGSFEYDRAYQCKKVSAALTTLKPEYIRYYDAERLGNPYQHICVQSYDLAIGKSRKSAHFASVTLLYDPNSNLIFVADAWHDRIGFAEQGEAVINQARLWHPDTIAIEETGYQEALRGYLNETAKVPLPIMPISPGSLSKELRLARTLTLFENGRILFNPMLDPQVHIERSALGDIVGQLREFPRTVENDLVDAFAYGIMAIQLYMQEEAEDERDSEWNKGDSIGVRVSML